MSWAVQLLFAESTTTWLPRTAQINCTTRHPVKIRISFFELQSANNL
jgi:hypothetical protein